MQCHICKTDVSLKDARHLALTGEETIDLCPGCARFIVDVIDLFSQPGHFAPKEEVAACLHL